jgi:hypothetical protein
MRLAGLGFLRLPAVPGSANLRQNSIVFPPVTATKRYVTCHSENTGSREIAHFEDSG